MLTKVTIPEEYLPEEFYIAGFICGDNAGDTGNARANYYRVGAFWGVRGGAESYDGSFSWKFNECMEKAYGITPKIWQHKTERGRIVARSYINSKMVWERQNSLVDVGKYTWRLKEPVLNLSDNDREKISNVIQGFFDAEGSPPSFAKGKWVRQIRACSVNDKGLNQMKYMLEKLSIDSRVKGPYENPGYFGNGDIYYLVITGRDNLERFYEEVNFSIYYKAEIFKYALLSYKNKSYGNYPKELLDLALELARKGMSARRIHRITGIAHHTLDPFLRENNLMRKPRLPYPEEKRDQVIMDHLLSRGKTKREIRERHGISRSTDLRWRKKHGLVEKPKPRYPEEFKKRVVLEYMKRREEARRTGKRGFLKELLEEFSIHKNTLKKWKKDERLLASKQERF